MNFEFFSPVKIVFGNGISKKIADHIPQSLNRDNMGSERDSSQKNRTRKALLITGKNSARSDRIIQNLKSSGVIHELMVQSTEPSVTDIISGVQMARETKSDLVVAIGGGSVVDTGKAIAALATNPYDIMRYLEIIGEGLSLTEKPLPMVAIPTTSGTGAEVTCNAVISSAQHKVKVSLRSQSMYPDVALIDPELSLSMSAGTTASTGMDALTQLIESFTSRFATPITDALCREGLSKIARSFKKAYDEQKNLEARSDMSLAALLSGITLSNAKLGAVHGIAGPMGGMIHAPHGVICARLLGGVIAANIVMLEKKINGQWAANGQTDRDELTSKSLMKYQEIARILTGNPDASAHDAITHINEIAKYMHIADIAFPAVDSQQISLIARQAEKSSSMKGNPVVLSYDQIRRIIAQEFAK